MRRGACRLGAWLLALFFCWGMALHTAQWLEREYPGVSVRINGAGVKSAALDEALAKDSSLERLSAWTRKSAALTNDELQAKAKAARIAVYGLMADVCPMEVLYGALPASADARGCVMEENTAQSLFRTGNVVGARLDVEGKEYIVRAVVRAREPMVLLRDPKAVYENLELVFPDVERGGERAQSFLYASVLAADYTLVESGFYAKAGAGLAGLPGWVMGGGMLLFLLARAWKRRSIPLQLVLLLMAFVLAFLLFRWLLGPGLYWPDRFLPTRWSDFDFWPETIRAQIAYFEKLSFLTPLPKDMQWREGLGRMLFFTLSASLAGAALVWGKEKPAPFAPGALLWTAFCAVAVFFALKAWGAEFLPTRGYLYAGPLWWAFTGCFIKSPGGLAYGATGVYNSVASGRGEKPHRR